MVDNASVAVALGTVFVGVKALKGRYKPAICFALSGLPCMLIWDPGRHYVANATALCPGLIYCCPCRGERKAQCKSCDENHLQHKLNTKVALSN